MTSLRTRGSHGRRHTSLTRCRSLRHPAIIRDEAGGRLRRAVARRRHRRLLEASRDALLGGAVEADGVGEEGEELVAGLLRFLPEEDGQTWEDADGGEDGGRHGQGDRQGQTDGVGEEGEELVAGLLHFLPEEDGQTWEDADGERMDRGRHGQGGADTSLTLYLVYYILIKVTA